MVANWFSILSQPVPWLLLQVPYSPLGRRPPLPQPVPCLPVPPTLCLRWRRPPPRRPDLPLGLTVAPPSPCPASPSLAVAVFPPSLAVAAGSAPPPPLAVPAGSASPPSLAAAADSASGCC